MLAEQQAGRDEPIERPVELGSGLRRNAGQQIMREFTADRGAELRHLLGFAETVQARQQGCLQRRRHRLAQRAIIRLQHGPRHLLHEQRDAVCSFDDVATDLWRQRAACGQSVDYGVGIALRQPPQSKRRHAGPNAPRRREFRTERHDHQQTKMRHPLEHEPQPFEARRVGPVCVLEDQQHGLIACELVDLVDERIERTLAALCGSLGGRDGRRSLRQHRIELVEPVGGAVGRRRTHRPLELADDGMEGARRVLRRAVVAQAAVRLRRKTLDEISNQPRFADASLAAEQDRCPSPTSAFVQQRASVPASPARPARGIRPLACKASKRLSTL